MKIAVVGSGISGLISALLLQQKHDVKVFEAASWIGGHAHTVPVQEQDKTLWIDTGFIVCNNKNYPNFIKLLDYLNISLQAISMSFSVKNEDSKLEYNGTSLNGIFAQRKNICNPKFWRMLSDISKFNNVAKSFAKSDDVDTTLEQFLEPLNLSASCINDYILPMTAAIWSNNSATAGQIPARFICEFYENHGMLNINQRPQWYSIPGGSATYITNLVDKLITKPQVNTKVHGVKCVANGVEVNLQDSAEVFDKVILATHSDQALRLLCNPTELEQNILSSIRYQQNSVILHTDTSILPENRRAWASWNYRVNQRSQEQGCTVTYNMNMLQNLAAYKVYCVTLNQEQSLNHELIISKFNYSHPAYDRAAIQAQHRHREISGVNNIYYCGAYWGAGFHEDGINSGLQVVKQIDKELFCAAPYILEQ